MRSRSHPSASSTSQCSIAIMNTGKQLERTVKTAVEHLVQTGKLGLIPECCRVYLNKGYFARDREREIIVDVSIEVDTAGNFDSMPYMGVGMQGLLRLSSCR